MENVLLKASMSGNTDILETLIQNDPLILDRVLATSFNENPLHIAVLRGHLDFVRILLIHKRELGNGLEALRRSPLHLASGGGYIEIVGELIKINPEVYHFHDQDGKIPPHFASFHEHVDIMNVLIQAKPELLREIFDNGERLLHFCVKHNHTEALKMLVKWFGDINDCTFVNTKDNRGNTILHLAVIKKQTQVSVFDNYSKNSLSTQSCSSKAKQFILMIWKTFLKSEPRWFEEARGNLLVAATVIASMAFQATVNPPSGVWQESSKDDPNTSKDEPHSHTAGCSIADLQPLICLKITISF